MSNRGVHCSCGSCSVLPPLKSLPVLQSGVCHFPSLLLTRGQLFCTAGIRAQLLSRCLLLPEPLLSQLCQTIAEPRKSFSAISSVPRFESEHSLRGEATQSCWQHQHLCGCSGGSLHVSLKSVPPCNPNQRVRAVGSKGHVELWDAQASPRLIQMETDPSLNLS